MSKRELEESSESPLPKKRKDGILKSDDVDMRDPIINGDAKTDEGSAVSKEKLWANSQGLVLWQTVKDAVNKENRVLSLDFMERPSKRQYADYYQQIQRPVFLQDVKTKLDANAYSSFEAVKQDLELCFTNAKAYNQRNSQIWKDAKHLHKLVLRESARIVPSEDSNADVEGGQPGGEGADGKKAKAPNMNRVLKSRLQKLIDKADDSGRIISEAFMELPSKKDWAIYYKEIKRPQCIENIFKRLKRKEYLTSADFAADIELVFSNALQFNQDHSPIWEDAKTLREYFRQLMSDLPPPFSLPEYSRPSKIKLKVPAAVSTSTPAAPPPQLPSSNSVTSSGGLLLRVPPASSAADTKRKSPPASHPAPDAVQQPAAAASAPPAMRPPVTATPAQAPTPPNTLPMAQLSYLSAAYTQHYPNATYASSTAAAASATRASTSSPSLMNPFLSRTAQARSVTPPPRAQYPLQAMLVTTHPLGRPFKLAHSDGVKSWAVKLGHGEKALTIANVRFLGGEEESSGDEEDVDRKEEEEEDGLDTDDVPVRNGRKKGKGKGKGRGRGSAAKAGPAVVLEKGKSKEILAKKAKRSVPLLDDVQVKLNGTLVTGEEGKWEWFVELPIGSHVVEVGAKGGMIWRVFAERVND